MFPFRVAGIRLLSVAALLTVVLSGCTTPENLFVLLDNPDGVVGSIRVKNAGGERVLDKPGQATRVDGADSAPSAPVMLEPKAIAEIFGATFAAQPERPVTFILYFTSGTTRLTDESRKKIEEIFNAVRTRKFPVLAVVGHTDRSGSARSNEILALRRARSVADRLVAAGADAKLIELSSHGENNPLIATADNVREPRNRRVEITVR
jgi:outer membrane protein OmpA-like peptidoglycan-associated protein